MTYRSIHPQFQDTFVYFESIPDLIKETLWNYIAHGLPPGGFVTSVLKNDFCRAMSSADHTWNGKSFKQLAKWIDCYMPSYMRGSEAAMIAWMEKSDEERRDIMIELKLRPNEFDILRGTAVA
jgi:hypothetical protein